jgi:4-alpha-glucanotransferase
VAELHSRLSPIRFGRAICGDLSAAERREWWLANGRGGYAGGTIAQSLTRRYHGLLVAPVDPPLGRVVVLTKADATLIADGAAQPLFTNHWASGAVEPAGYLALESFHLDGTIPIWRFAIGGRIVEERIWLEPGADTVHVAWRLSGAPGGPTPRLVVTLLANGRDHHGDTWPQGFSPDVAVDGSRLRMTVPNRFVLEIAAAGGMIASRNEWYRDFDLPVERERGLGAQDSQLHIGEPHAANRAGHRCGTAAPARPRSRGGEACSRRRHRFRDGARLGHAARAGDRGVHHRPAAARLAARAVGDRRLPVVWRLGPRHDDLAAGIVPRDRAL